ncbi:MAG: sigma-54-dependent Fis family transcriptional regulator [Caldisericaceae bacterium]|nr:sigma-54-dependent Fis family transcriptional regulator [Caldisericaceae bacterium]
MISKNNILIVDDDATMGDVLSDILSAEGYHVQLVGNGSDAIKYIKQNLVDVLLLDLLLPGMNGIEILKQIIQIKPLIVVVMMSGHGTIHSAIEATRLGAYEWLEKPLEKDRVLLTIRNAVEKSILQKEKNILLAEAKETYKMIGASPEIKRIYQLIDKIAPTDITVLITGESGTGKELVARAIHNNSKRSAYPFVEINCAAVPDTLIESELFGHTKGSFTGAVTDQKGKFQQADEGTLFMDEIGDLSVIAQAKVLRAIEAGEVAKIGTNKIDKVDVRIISATNMNLSERIKQSLFREDLYHRINVVEIHIPPLRTRCSDILPLLYYFLEFYASKNNTLKKELEPSAEAFIVSYNWPGNVRELKNFAEKLTILVDSQKVNTQQIVSLLELPKIDFNYKGTKSLSEAKRSFEKQFIINALKQNDWNISKTADAINMHRSLLYRKMEKYGIKEDSQKVDK